MPAQRAHRGLVALSASAIASVYMAGYMRTQSADASIGVAADSPMAAQSATAVATPRPPVLAPPAAPTPGSASAPGAAAQGAYKDGAYTGQGTSRRGGVAVSVVVQGGRITSVTITQSTLQYPLRDIAGLPAQVVQRQSPQVDTVSRATYSSQAFRGAVAQALSNAG